MKHRHTDTACPPAAPCRGARWLLIGAALIALAAVLVIGGQRLMAGPRPEAPAAPWMRTFHLSRPALWPSGTPRRHPETAHPGIDLRSCAGLEPRR